MVKDVTKRIQQIVDLLVEGVKIANRNKMEFDKEATQSLSEDDARLEDVWIKITTTRRGEIKINTTIVTNKGFYGQERLVNMDDAIEAIVRAELSEEEIDSWGHDKGECK